MVSLIGRYDIARALEKWGGLQEVSRLLSLKVRHPNRQAALPPPPPPLKEKKIGYLTTNDANGGEKPSSAKPNVPQNTHKWLAKLKEFDINWVE